MFRSLTLILPFVALLISHPIECSIESFGYMPTAYELKNPWGNGLDQSGHVVFAGKPIELSGSVFAFTANISGSSQFYFQIYRPAHTANGSIAYRLAMSLGVIPTARGKWEDFYVESFLGKQCVFVRPGDRLALHFPTIPPPVVYGTRLKSNQVDDVDNNDYSSNMIMNSMNPGDIIYLNPPSTWTFLASGFVNTNVTAPDNDTTLTNCTRGVVIPVPNLSPATVTTTTYIPPTGIPGSKGVTGQQGATGQQGDTGNTGPQGAKGATGNTGNTGSVGWTGAVGDAGSMGENFTVQGKTGENGTTGDTGPMGPMGITGILGPAGPMGINLTFILNGPNAGELLSDVFWQKDACMQGVYIWLAIASFVALVGLLFLVADCCLAGQSKSDL